MDEKKGITLRIYECRKSKCEFDGVVETCEAAGKASNSKANRAKAMALKLRTAMRKITREMRTTNLDGLEKQALKFAAGWIERKYP